MSRRNLAILCALLAALGPASTSALASARTPHCHESAVVSAGHDAAARDARRHEKAEPADTLAHHAPAAHGEPPSPQTSAHDCGCDCTCAAGHGCSTLGPPAGTHLTRIDWSSSRPESGADSSHASLRGPPPSPPPISSST